MLYTLRNNDFTILFFKQILWFKAVRYQQFVNTKKSLSKMCYSNRF